MENSGHLRKHFDKANGEANLATCNMYQKLQVGPAYAMLTLWRNLFSSGAHSILSKTDMLTQNLCLEADSLKQNLLVATTSCRH